MTQRSDRGPTLSRGRQRWREDLLTAIDEYPVRTGDHYDEVFDATSKGIQRAQAAGKADIAALSAWKRSAQGRWLGELMARPESSVRETTRQAFQATGDAARLRTLADLPGFRRRGPIATLLLCAFDPSEYGIMDRRALAALDELGLGVDRSRGMTVRYLAHVRLIRDELRARRGDVTARAVDQGLYVLGGPRES